MFERSPANRMRWQFRCEEGKAMLSLLVIVVVSFVVCVVLAVAAWIDFAIRGERILAERREAAGRWRPPFLRGTDLFGWAKETTQ